MNSRERIKIIKGGASKEEEIPVQRIDPDIIERVKNDAWPKEGNISTPDLHERYYAKKIIDRIDRHVDYIMGPPTTKTIKGKHEDDPTMSELEVEVLNRQNFVSPDKLRDKAKQEFNELWEADSEKSPNDH